MLTGPWATTERTTCNNSGGLNLLEKHGKLLGGIIVDTFSYLWANKLWKLNSQQLKGYNFNSSITFAWEISREYLTLTAPGQNTVMRLQVRKQHPYNKTIHSPPLRFEMCFPLLPILLVFLRFPGIGENVGMDGVASAWDKTVGPNDLVDVNWELNWWNSVSCVVCNANSTLSLTRDFQVLQGSQVCQARGVHG